MTPPIPAGAPRKRPARSCLSCRSSKLKCLGAVTLDDNVVGEAATKCVRCQSLGLTCEFVALHRKGRPRRLLKRILSGGSDEKERDSDDEQDYPEYVPSMSTTPTDASGSSVPSHTAENGLVEWCPTNDVSIPGPIHDPVLVAQAYLLNVHPFLPLLSTDLPSLTTYLATSSSVLSQAIWALSFPATSPPLNLVPFSLSTSMADLQTALMLSYLAYGLAHTNPGAAREFSQHCSQGIVDNGLNRVDSPAATRARMEAGLADEEQIKMIRRLCWQAWIMEVNVAVLTGVRVLTLQGIDFDVLVEEPLGDTMTGQPLTLYIRALSLLLTCTEPPTSASGERNPSVSESIANVASNLTMIAHSLYSGTEMSADLVTSPDLMAYREMALNVSLTACAATIFYVTPTFSAAFFVCGFDSTAKLSPYSSSLLRNASQMMYTLLRNSLSPVNTAANLYTHSPMFGCHLVLGSTGSLLALSESDSPWHTAACISQFDLAEVILTQLALKWSAPKDHLGALKGLRLSLVQKTDEWTVDTIGFA